MTQATPEELDKIAEECAKELWDNPTIDYPEGLVPIIRSALALSREEIIEECAKVCDVLTEQYEGYEKDTSLDRTSRAYALAMSDGSENCATAIRALVHSTDVPSEQIHFPK